jgi:hypothetical protein
MKPVIALRPVEDADLDALFDQKRDPEAVRMAAFTAENPEDRDAFDAYMAKVSVTYTTRSHCSPISAPVPSSAGRVFSRPGPARSSVKLVSAVPSMRSPHGHNAWTAFFLVRAESLFYAERPAVAAAIQSLSW